MDFCEGHDLILYMLKVPRRYSDDTSVGESGLEDMQVAIRLNTGLQSFRVKV